MDKLILLCIGGSLGTLSRYGLGLWAKTFFNLPFPYGTLTANLLGCLLIGTAFAFTEIYPSVNSRWTLLVITGFLGALTTFSTFELELFGALKNGQFQTALLYLGISIGAGLLAVWCGYQITTRLFS